MPSPVTPPRQHHRAVADGPPCDLESLRQRTAAHLGAHPRQCLPRTVPGNRRPNQRVGKSQPQSPKDPAPRTTSAARPDLSSRRSDVGQSRRPWSWMGRRRPRNRRRRTKPRPRPDLGRSTPHGPNPAGLQRKNTRPPRLNPSNPTLRGHHRQQRPRPDLARRLQCALLLASCMPATPTTEPPNNASSFARQLAAMLGADRNYHDTEFGPTNVAMHAVGVAVELGNGQQAIDRAAHVRHPEQLSPERQARYLIDIARAHLLTRSLPRRTASPRQSRTHRRRRTRRITPRRRTSSTTSKR